MKPPEGIPLQWNGKTFTWSWEYRDRAGAILGYVARFDGSEGNRDFIPHFKPSGTGFDAGYIEPRPLFGLDTLNNPVEPVYIAEGEKSTATLHCIGLQAVCSPGGANSAAYGDWTPLQGFGKVFILPDADAPGETYARAVSEILVSLPGQREVLIARLPGLSEHGDVVDWLQARVPAWDGYEPIPQGADIRRELLEAIEAAAMPATIEAKDAPEQWETPVPLDAAVIPPWPRNVFPPAVQAFTDALSAATETPPELPAMMTLAVLATATQGRYCVMPKPGYFEPCCLWTLCAMPPGSRKTAVLQAATAPLVQWESAARTEAEPKRARAESERKTIEARIEALRKKASKSEAEEVKGILQEIEALEHDMPEVTPLPQIFGADVTSEHLGVLMAENKERMALLCDEGGIFDTLAGRYSNGIPNLDIYLQGHAGSPVRVNRGSREPIFLQRPCLSIGLLPQPDVVCTLQDKPSFRGRGLLGRFLYAMPESNLGRRTLDAPPMRETVADSYAATVKAMLNHPIATDKGGEPCAHILGLSPQAAAMWREFAIVVEAGLAPGGQFENTTDWAGKLPGAVARIAAILHVARHAHGKPWESPVSFDDMDAAVRLADVLSKHALTVFDAMGADPSLDDARAVLAWIKREGLTEFTRRDSQKAMQSRFRRADELDAPLDILQERGYIRTRPQAINPHGGRPSRVYEVNPLSSIQDR